MTTLTHAGGILVRRQDDAIEYLLVQAKGNPRHWIFPKGHIEPGETPDQAARREVREEAGVDGEVLEQVGRSRFAGPRGPVHVAYYLMRFVKLVAAEEDRQIVWCRFEDANEKLTFEDTRACLATANSLVVGGRLTRRSSES
jgi:8-oxo-dGTP pyrophosphatase MutT (NUDIX family)